MTTTYSTVVVHVPPTPLGLLPERWTIEHRCNLCRQRVEPDQLVVHAQGHDTPLAAALDRPTATVPASIGVWSTIRYESTPS